MEENVVEVPGVEETVSVEEEDTVAMATEALESTGEIVTE